MGDGSVLIHALSGLHGNVQGLLFMIALCSVRILVLFIVLPATGAQAITGMARMGVVYLLTWFVAAGQTPDLYDNLGASQMLMLTLKEAFIGLVMGYAASTIFWIAQSAGTLIDDLTGFNNVQMTNPLQGDQSTPVASLLLQLTITLFYVSGGLAVLLGVIFQSFRWWPLASTLPDMQGMALDLSITQSQNVLAIAARICVPVMLALVLVDIGLGVIARAAGKLEPNSLSQPLRGLIGVLLLVALIPAVATQVREAVHFSGFESLLNRLNAPAATQSHKSPLPVTPIREIP